MCITSVCVYLWIIVCLWMCFPYYSQRSIHLCGLGGRNSLRIFPWPSGPWHSKPVSHVLQRFVTTPGTGEEPTWAAAWGYFYLPPAWGLPFPSKYERLIFLLNIRRNVDVYICVQVCASVCMYTYICIYIYAFTCVYMKEIHQNVNSGYFWMVAFSKFSMTSQITFINKKPH